MFVEKQLKTIIKALDSTRCSIFSQSDKNNSYWEGILPELTKANDLIVM